MTWEPKTKEDFETRDKIRENPYYWACFRIESSENPLIANKTSSAKGAFQLTRAICQAFHVKDPFDITENFNAFVKLTNENRERFGDDPNTLYSAHYLGATLKEKLLEGEELDEDEETIVEYYDTVVYKRFKKVYDDVVRDMSEGV